MLPQLKARLVEIYRLGRARYVRLLLATLDVQSLGQTARTVAALAAMDRVRGRDRSRANSTGRRTEKGEHIDRGHRVGTVGPTPTGAAGLYFELRIDGRPVDPLQW